MFKAIKGLFFLISLSFMTVNVYGQAFKPGVFGGIVTSQVGGDGYSGFNKLGVTLGGFVRYSLSKNWTTQFEIAYVQKGSRNNFSITENNVDQVQERFLMRMNYIEIPVLFKFKHNNFVYEGGLYYSRMIGFFLEYFNGYSTTGPFDNLDDFNSQLEALGQSKKVMDWDFGGMVGVGYAITDNILGSIRLSNSFVAIKEFESGKKDFYPTSFRIGWTNTALLGSIRFTFGEGDEKHIVTKKE